MTDAASELEEVIATEYFRQYENIVRGKNKAKCVEQFIQAWRVMGGPSGESGQKQLERLVASLNEAHEHFSTPTNVHVSSAKGLNARSLIYCFIGSLVCVLLLHYA